MREAPFTPARRGKALVALVETQSTPDAAEVVGAELLDHPQPAVPDAVIDAVLTSYLHDGRLVPATRAEVPDGVMDADQRRRLERARLLDEMRASALADGTLRHYGGHLRAWLAWCEKEAVPALPFDPQRVADFLLDYVLEWDADAGEYARNPDGDLLASVAARTAANRLNALNKAAEFIGLPRPGDNPGVKQVMSGMRRRFGTAATGKAALDLKLLNRCLATTSGTTFISARDRVTYLLRARTAATAGQLATLRWSDLDLAEGGQSVTVTLPKAHRHGKPLLVTVAAHRNPALCLVTAIRELQLVAPKLREVITHRTGKPLTRQAVHAALARVWDDLPTMTDAQLGGLLARHSVTAPPTTARDRALLLVGFYTALRRSNLSALNWRDLTDHGEDGWSAQIRFSKTDQEGKGSTLWVPRSGTGSSLSCPATALREWKDALEAALDRPVRPDEPVFVSLTRTGAVKRRGENARPARLPGNGVNEVVQRLTVAAGIATTTGSGNPYGAHSLRAGFVTEATRDDKLSILEVMEVTGHKTTTMVARYRREANAPRSNAARKLMILLNEATQNP